MVVLDLFSGAGGLTEGFLKEGFEIIAHIEKEKWACETLKTRLCYYYLKEHNDLELYHEYIRRSNNYKLIDDDREFIFEKYPELKEKLNFEVLNKSFGNPANDRDATSTQDIIRLVQQSLEYHDKNSIDLIIGGPPCQAYSIIGRARMKDSVHKDKRNYLFYYYKELVRYFQPTMFIFENVPGILSAQNGRIFTTIQEEFESIGYTLLSGPSEDPRENIIDASEFGVYQNRKRVILFGFRTGLNLPYPDIMRHATIFNEEHNTLNAIGDLPALRPGEGNDFFHSEYTQDANLSQLQRYMREDSIGVVNHKARRLQEQDQAIYTLAIEHAIAGRQLKYVEIPREFKTHKNQNNFEDRFKVHRLDTLPHTIVAHISKDGHYNIHPDITQCRSLSVREAARIQSFPDNFKFEGPRTSQFVQVGNAVPPLLAHAIANSIKEFLIDY